jgi:hypothetical protein
MLIPTPLRRARVDAVPYMNNAATLAIALAAMVALDVVVITEARWVESGFYGDNDTYAAKLARTFAQAQSSNLSEERAARLFETWGESRTGKVSATRFRPNGFSRGFETAVEASRVFPAPAWLSARPGNPQSLSPGVSPTSPKPQGASDSSTRSAQRR